MPSLETFVTKNHGCITLYNIAEEVAEESMKVGLWTDFKTRNCRCFEDTGRYCKSTTCYFENFILYSMQESKS